jgi:hypothetical protein
MNKWKESFSILAIGLSFCALILLIQPAKQYNTYVTKIPKTTTQHYLLNGEKLFKKLIFSELFIHKDEIITQKIKDLVSKKTVTKSHFSELSLNLFHPIEIIRFKKSGKHFTAIKFKIDNHDAFDHTSAKMTNELIFRNESFAYYIFGQPKNKTFEFKVYLKSNLFTYTIKNQGYKQYISVFENSKLISQSTIGIKDNNLLIEKKQNKLKESYKHLVPKGFHFSTTLNTSDYSGFQDEKVLDIINWKDLKYVSLNYDGFIFLDYNELIAIPRFEIYLSYKNKISGDLIVQDLINQFKLPFITSKTGVFQSNKETIRVNQLDTNQIIISTMPMKSKLVKTELNPFFSGDPKNIVKISNAGWKGLFLELIPGFKASKNLLETTNKIYTFQNKNGAQVTCLSFKKDKDALHSLLRFTLSFK